VSRRYGYVGPEALRRAAASAEGGEPILSVAELSRWLSRQRQEESFGLIAATYVVDVEGRLLLADRRSEHVACSRGAPVLAAGEIFLEPGEPPAVHAVSNLSTGYCPEPESWGAVEAALDRLGVAHPGWFTEEFTFRRCPVCGGHNLVKDGELWCELCRAQLPAQWNFDSEAAE
jgi:hypothetical protein